jgi:hypothetical protein
VATTPVGLGYPAHDLYVRRFWTAIMGPTAIAELLRIAEAGRTGKRIRRPIHLQNLMEMGLVSIVDGDIVIGDLIPPVPQVLIRRLAPALRAAHERWESPKVQPLSAEGSPARQRQGDRFPDRKAQRNPKVGSTARNQHGHDSGGETAHPGTGELTGGAVGDQSLTDQLRHGTSDDAGGSQGGHRGRRTKLGPEQELHNVGTDDEPHHRSQPDEGQPESDQLGDPLPKVGFAVHPDEKRKEPTLKVVDQRQRRPVKKERSEDDAA